MAYIFTKQFSGTAEEIMQFSGGKSIKMSDDSKETLIKALDMVSKTPGLNKINKATEKLIANLPEEEKALVEVDTSDLGTKVAAQVKDKIDMNADLALSKDEVKVAAEALSAYAKLLDPKTDKQELMEVHQTAKELQPYSKVLPISAAAAILAALIVTTVVLFGKAEAKKYTTGMANIKAMEDAGTYSPREGATLRPTHVGEGKFPTTWNEDTKIGKAIGKFGSKFLPKVLPD